jgi:hypothetical protein
MFAGRERELQQENALSQAYKSALGGDGAIDRNKLYSGLAQGGLGAKLPGIQKGFTEQDEAKAKLSKQKIELVDARLKQSRAYLESVATPEQYIAWHEANHKDEILGPELASRGVTADQARSSIAKALSEPGGFERLLKQSQLGLEKFSEIYKPKVETRNLGGTTETMMVDPITGRVTVTNSAKNTQSPDSIASTATTIRGQNLTDARGREANEINRQLVGQERQLKIDKLQAEKDDRTRQKQTAIAKAEESLAIIDKAINHPGRKAATGTSSVLDPRNYIAGTEPMNFQVVLDQLGGQAFLQAFESLKGGGQITEVEGKKATDAMARLNRKQSDAEFKKSLEDLRSVVSTGLARAKGGSAEPVAPAPGAADIDALLKKYGG